MVSVKVQCQLAAISFKAAMVAIQAQIGNFP
jgi:hypothetical protein